MIASGGQSLSRSVMNQNNIDESEDLRPKILLMGLRRYVKSIWKSVLHYLRNNKEDYKSCQLLFICIVTFRSGKSSIQKVVFHKMSPNETLFLESTNKIIKEDISNSSFVKVNRSYLMFVINYTRNFNYCWNLYMNMINLCYSSQFGILLDNLTFSIL